MKNMWKLSAVLLIALAIHPSISYGEAKENTEKILYAVDPAFQTKGFDIQALLSNDFSNPYMQIYGVGLNAYYHLNSLFAFGLGGTYYDSSKKLSAKDLEFQLSRHGYTLETFAPNYSLLALAKITPVSGVMNFLSASLVKAEFSLLLRSGMIHYGTPGSGFTMGAGLETSFAFSSGLGVHTSVLFDWDKVSGVPWQNRVNVIIGPFFRF